MNQMNHEQTLVMLRRLGFSAQEIDRLSRLRTVAQAFALPRDLTALGVKRYGFHGLSYEYIAHVLPRFVGIRADGRVVVAHLWSGASMCALRGRESCATTTGLTALDGLPMGTRCGALDSGVVLYLLSEQWMVISVVTDLLYHRSGLHRCGYLNALS